MIMGPGASARADLPADPSHFSLQGLGRRGAGEAAGHPLKSKFGHRDEQVTVFRHPSRHIPQPD